MRSALRQTVLVGMLSAWAAAAPAAPNPLELSEPFVADDGSSVRLAQWTGRPVILAMEYSNCRFLCSITLRKLKDIQDEADRRRLALEFVIISIDPEHDTPASWQEYRRSRGLDRQNWRVLTGSRAATDRLVAMLGIKWWYYDEHLMHDFRIVRLAPGGEIAAVMAAFDMMPAELLDAR